VVPLTTLPHSRLGTGLGVVGLAVVGLEVIGLRVVGLPVVGAFVGSGVMVGELVEVSSA